MAGHGMAWPGTAWRGSARHGSARHGPRSEISDRGKISQKISKKNFPKKIQNKNREWINQVQTGTGSELRKKATKKRYPFIKIAPVVPRKGDMMDAAGGTMPKEIWKSIPGYNGYEASNLGHVRSLERVLILRNRWGDLKPRRYRGRLLKQAINSFGYKCVKLGWHAEKEEVHRLVLLAFRGARPPRHECAHWDGDPANNNLKNLRYATKSENYQDSVRHGTCKCRQSEPESTIYYRR